MKTYPLMFFVVLLLAAGVETLAQTGSRIGRATDRTATGLGSTLEQFFELDPRSQQIPIVIPLEEAVEPTEYIVGPNDVFALLALGAFNTAFQLVVSPEGTLIVPGAGEIQVAGQNLEQVKTSVIAEVTRAFKITKPSFTLFTPRQFIVNIVGAVQSPGPYIASAAMRVDKVIALANDRPQGISPAQIAPPSSTRNIILRRKGQPDRRVDLDRYLATPRSEFNPFVLEGDIIMVPKKDLDQSAVSVYGAVNMPNQYEYRETDSLGAMIRIAGGLTPNADPSNVELTRLSRDAASMEVMIIDATRILQGVEPDYPVQNKDRVLVRQKHDRRRDYKVHVRGEIMLPGMYPITPDSTRLSEIIRRAGGLTENAFLPNAEVERKILTAAGEYVDLAKEALVNLRMNDQLVTPEERAYYDLEASLRRGTVAVDFVGLLERNDKSQDIILKDGDIVFIPSSDKTVYVYGQVARPGFVAYKQGADIRFYIDQAGGYGEEANNGGTRIIKGKTREWLDPSLTTIEPGDYVWVPKDIRYPTGYYLNLVSQAASFISVVLSMTVIILQLTK
ncbi:MAG: SLBB domain-containing protein [Ignavibacteriales bacterium]|nr:SLBB domain-containing protein [Ignavibacteriales bacterium]